MYNKKFLLIFGMLICFNAIETPVQAKMITYDTTLPTLLLPSLYPIAALYIGYNCLIRQKYLVAEKFPQAQAWYNAIALKYPQANLDKIHFIEAPKSDMIPDMLADIAKKCSWPISSNRIFMSKDTLKEINFLYKKVLDGYPLDEKENGKLAGHEFSILYEAGYIKNSDVQTLLATTALLLGSTKIIESYQNEDITTTKDNVILQGYKDVFGITWFKFAIPGTLTTISTASFIAALVTILRYQSANADKFAIESADLAALKNGLKSFENNDTDPLYDIEKAKMSPYIKTHSYIEMFFQHLVGSAESIIGFTQKQFFMIAKSTKPTRFLFDLVWQKNIFNAGPSVRAQTIKDEINRRQDSNN